MTLDELNGLPVGDTSEALGRCCGSSRWIERMIARRPFHDRDALFEAARLAFGELEPNDWRQAFTHHPRIGDVESLRTRFASTANWAQSEQAGTAGGSEEVLQALAEGNRTYEARFGYIFIVCATGKRAQEMLALLSARMNNAPDDELRIAAGEQEKITRLRLEKLLES